MPRIPLLLCVLAASAALVPAALGQNLEKVEKRVEKALDLPGGAAPAEEAPPAELPPPAATPRTGEGALPPPPADSDEPKSGYLGVVLEETGGALTIAEVTKDSPAEKAGLKAGDVIKAVNKAAVKDIEELGQKMEPVAAGEKLTLTIEREGKETTIVATLGEPPAAPREPGGVESEAGERPPAPAETPREGDSARRASLGISVVTFAGNLRLGSEVPARSGALVSMIRPDSPAAKAGMPAGCVIVAYDGQKVETAEDLVELIRASKPGEEVELTYYQGPTLRRKNVTLAAAADPGLPGPGYGGTLSDGPLSKRVERTLEGLTRPGPGDTGDAAPGSVGRPAAIPGTAAESASLRQEVEELKSRVEALEERIKELEGKLAAEKKAEGAGPGAPAEAPDGTAAPAAVPADEGAPVVPRSRAPARGASGSTPKLLPPKNRAGAKIGDE